MTYTVKLLLLLFSTLGAGHAQSINKLLETHEVVNLRKKATLQIKIYKNEKNEIDIKKLRSPLAKKIRDRSSKIEKELGIEEKKHINHPRGAAFFFGSEGYILTAHHLFKDFLKKEGLRYFFVGSNGEELEAKPVHCSDDRNIDLCLFKSNSKPEAYFPARNNKIGSGHPLWSIGHCNNNGWKATPSEYLKTVSNIHQKLVLPNDKEWARYNKGVKVLIHGGEQCSGSSGGPLFDTRGDLHGLLAVKYQVNNKAREVLNTAVSIEEMMNFYIKNKE